MFFDVFLIRSKKISMFLLSMIWETSFIGRRKKLKKVFSRKPSMLIKSREKWFKVRYIFWMLLPSDDEAYFKIKKTKKMIFQVRLYVFLIFQVEKVYNKWWTKTCQSVYLSLLNWNCSLTLSHLTFLTHFYDRYHFWG